MKTTKEIVEQELGVEYCKKKMKEITEGCEHLYDDSDENHLYYKIMGEKIKELKKSLYVTNEWTAEKDAIDEVIKRLRTIRESL